MYEVPLTLAEHDSDIKIKACSKIPQSFVTRFCAYNLLRYQVSVYRNNGPLVTIYGRGGHLCHVTWTIYTNFCSPFLRRLYMKFDFNWPSGFRGVDI